MATNNQVPYGYGGPVPRDEPEAAPVPEAKSRSSCACGKSAICWSVFILACIAVVVGVCYFAGKPYDMGSNFAALESKQVSDLRAGLNKALKRPRFEQVAREHATASGHECWSVLLGQGVLDEALMTRLVSIQSETDSKADKLWIEEGGSLPSDACSLTAPKLGDLKGLIDGREHCVIATFNARNWNNYPDDGVIVIWADRNDAEWLTLDVANEQYGITAEDWADPAGKLFGKKAPFQFTHE
jgi:hypothetical protein